MWKISIQYPAGCTQTHDLQIVSLLLWPLVQGSRHCKLIINIVTVIWKGAPIWSFLFKFVNKLQFLKQITSGALQWVELVFKSKQNKYLKQGSFDES